MLLRKSKSPSEKHVRNLAHVKRKRERHELLEIINRSGAASDLYKACDRALRRIPGRLAVATVAGNTLFAAVSGVSIASAATFSRIAYPEMQKAGYNKSFALGVISGSACLGMLIPPSVLLIVWADSQKDYLKVSYISNMSAN